jgi:hypothetical protein
MQSYDDYLQAATRLFYKDTIGRFYKNKTLNQSVTKLPGASSNKRDLNRTIGGNEGSLDALGNAAR